MPRLSDLRCDGVRRTGTGAGQLRCGYLLCRVDPSTLGAVETKCPRCNTIRLWALTGALMAVTT